MEREFLITSKYKVRLDNQPSFYDFGTIIEFYQPLIGLNGTALYLTLFNEKKDNLNIEMLNPHSRLLALTQLNQNDFLSELTKLESYGLIRTYISKLRTKEIYTYLIIPPRAIRSILKDKNFLDLLKFKLDENDFGIILDKWKAKEQDLGMELTQEININYDLNKDIGYKLKISFDKNLFQEFLNQYKININDFSEKELERIINLFGIYNIQYYELALFINESWSNKKLNLNLFEKKLTNFINTKRKSPEFIEPLRTTYRNNKLLSEKIKLFLKTSNIKHFETLYNRAPTIEEMNFLKSLNEVKKISPPIINVLLDYSFFRNNKFVKNYIDKISDTFIQNGITDILDAFYFLKNVGNKQTRSISQNKKRDNIKKEIRDIEPKRTGSELHINERNLNTSQINKYSQNLSKEEKIMWEEFFNDEW